MAIRRDSSPETVVAFWDDWISYSIGSKSPRTIPAATCCPMIEDASYVRERAIVYWHWPGRGSADSPIEADCPLVF